MQSNIELQKPRDFGEIINDTFVFIRQNFKYLLKYFFIFCGFFVIAVIATSILQQVKMMNSASSDPNLFANDNSRFAFFGLPFFLNIIFVLLGYSAVTVTVLCYITLYKIKGNVPPDTEEMWGYFKFYYFKSTLYMVILGFGIGLGFVFCIIPGVYLYNVFALVLPILIVENTTFGYAINHSFKLIKDNWWVTFGVLFIVSIITSIASAIISLPATLMNAGSLLFHIPTNHNVSIATTIIATVAQQIATIFQIIPAIAVSLCYFSLTESKEGTGLLDRIKDFGTGKPGENITPEEY